MTLVHRLLDNDEATYAAVAALMNAGGRLYADGGVDNKPPVIFWLYSLTFRTAGLYDMFAVHLLKIAVVAATSVVVAAIARRVSGPRAGWVAAALYAGFTAIGYPKMAAANTEVFMMLPLCASVLMMIDGRWLAAGGLIALAAFTKQVAVFQLLLVPLAMVQWRELWRPPVGTAVGFLAGSATLLLVLFLTGSVGGFLRWAVLSIVVGYGPSAWRQGLFQAGLRTDGLTWATGALLLWVPALFRLLDLRAFRREEVLVAGWLAASALGVASGGHFFGHYFIQLVGPLAVLSAVAVARWSSYAARPQVAAVAAALLLLPGLRLALAAYRFPDPAGAGVVSLQAYTTVAAYLHDHTAAGDRVFVWGNWPALYVYSGRAPGTRFPGFLRGAPRGVGIPPDNWDTDPEVWPALGDDFAAHPPALIADTSTAGWTNFGPYPMTRFPVLPEIVKRRYVRLAVVDGVTIYRLR